MITVISFILLKTYFGVGWTGWLLVLPVCLDFSLIGWVDRLAK